MLIFFNLFFSNHEVMDSLGITSDKLEKLKQIFGDSFFLTYNAEKLQSDKSDLCGLFCIFFIYKRSVTTEFRNCSTNFFIIVRDFPSLVVLVFSVPVLWRTGHFACVSMSGSCSRAAKPCTSSPGSLPRHDTMT